MPELLTLAAAFILLTVAGGLLRLLRGPGGIDRLAAMQLVGSGGTAALVLLSVSGARPSLLDLALLLAILSTFASAAATSKITLAPARPPVGPGRR
jgi:multicomponent Na+:H+ antiporter subunit F